MSGFSLLATVRLSPQGATVDPSNAGNAQLSADQSTITFTDTDAEEHVYVVSAVNAGGESSESNLGLHEVSD
jgi:hypothetical protein